MRGTTRMRRGRRTRAVAMVVAAAVATLGAGSAPAFATAGSDALNVAFTGSLVGTSSYTTAGSETMHGDLAAVTGDEEQGADGGVTLSGGAQGIHFTPSDLGLGSDTMTHGFLAELEFTPAAQPADMATLFSAGGDFYVRAQSGELVYGFDSVAGSTWTSHRQSVPYPQIGTTHDLSLEYLPGDTSTELHVTLDGTALPTVTSSVPAALNTSVADEFGIGNEVHPAGLQRGFAGTIAKVRIAAATGPFSASDYEFQPSPLTDDLLDVGYGGTVAGSDYDPAGDDVVTGALRMRTGSEKVGSGALTLGGGARAADFTATDAPLGTTSLDRAFVVEAEFTPSADQAELGTLLAVGGNLFVRYQGGELRYGFSGNAGGSWKDFTQDIAVPASGTQHTISVAYVPSATATSMIVWLDGVKEPTVQGTEPSAPNPAVQTTLSIGNEVPQVGGRGFVGSIAKTRFALLDGDFAPAAFTYQSLTEQNCDPVSLDPANYVTVTAADCDADILKKATLVRPTSGQLDWQELRLTAFVHFGINTFYNQEWGDGTEDPKKFDPTGDLDPAAWVKELRDAGFREAILVVKHHDGFLLYPSRYSDFGVASSPWKNGTGDVLKEFTDAARRYGMKVGVYLSPADSHEELLGVYGNGSAAVERTIPTLVPGDDRAGTDIPTFHYKADDYGEYFLNLLYEVLTQYGPIDEVWFDGAAGDTTKHEPFDYPAFYSLIHKLQPNALIAVGGRDIRWVGNETGVARDDEWGPQAISDPADGGLISTVGSASDASLGSDSQLLSAVHSGAADDLHWWPAEADMKLTSGWFAHPGDQPASPSSLLHSYDVSTGHNGMQLLNVPPTTTGAFAPASVTAIDGFAAERRKTFTKNVALGADATADGKTVAAVTDGNSRTSWATDSSDPDGVEIDLGSPQRVDTVTLSEDTAAHGQSVDGFTVQAQVDGTWTTIADGGTIGVYRVLPLSTPVTAQRFRVSVDKARGPYSLADVSLYQTLDSDPGLTTDVYLDCSAPVAGDGSSPEHPFTSLEQFRQTELAVGATVHIKSGTRCADSDTPFWGYGTAQKPITVTTYGGDVMPTAGKRTMEAVFAPLTAQGWKIELPAAAAPTVTLDRTSVAAGAKLSVTLDGFAAARSVEVSLHSDPIALGTVTTDSHGHAALTVTIPASVDPGDHQIVATQGSTSARAAVTVTVPAPGDGGGSGSGPSTGGSGSGSGSGSSGAGSGGSGVAGTGGSSSAGSASNGRGGSAAAGTRSSDAATGAANGSRSATGPLATTGSDTEAALAGALLLLLVGAAAAAAAAVRRRRIRRRG